MNRLGRLARGTLLVLFLCALVVAQAASFANEHPHPHSSSQHCCSVCHAGPLPFLQPTPASSIAPQLVAAWCAGVVVSQLPIETLRSGKSSRAPPSLSA